MDFPSPSVPLPKRTPWEVQRSVLIALFQRELKARFNGRWLNAFWTFLEPAAHLGFMMMIGIFVRHRIVPGMPLPLFLITGVVPFVVFRNISVRLMGSIEGNRALFGYRQVKPIDPLLARVAVETVLYSFIYACFLAGLGWYGIQWFPARPLELIGVSLILILQGFGLGLILAIVTDSVPRVRVFVRLAFMPIYMVSGVVFHVRNMSDEVINWLSWNPLLHLFEYSRGFFTPTYPVIRQANLTYPAAFALITLALGLAMYRVGRQRLLER